MQVDKYIGRKADEEKFHQLLETFFTVRGQLQVMITLESETSCLSFVSQMFSTSLDWRE